MELTREALAKRIEALRRQREQVVAEGNRQIAMISGAIEVLEQLVRETEEDKAEVGG